MRQLEAVGFQLRRPSAEALAWVERALGGGARVVACRRMTGGIVAAVHRLTVKSDGGRQVVVLRQYEKAAAIASSVAPIAIAHAPIKV